MKPLVLGLTILATLPAAIVSAAEPPVPAPLTAAAGLPLLAAFARREPGRLHVAAGPAFSLDMEISF